MQYKKEDFIIPSLVLILFFVILAALNPTPSQSTTTNPANNIEQKHVSQSLTSKDRLEKAEELMSKINSEETSLEQKLSLSKEARQELYYIPKSDKLSLKAKKHITYLSSLESRINSTIKETEKALKAVLRKEFAKKYEAKMLSEGYDFHIRTSGINQEIITFKYILMSRPLAYQLSNNDEFNSSIRSAGFKKVILTDGYDHSWTIDFS